jgi:hypothetical protein
VVDFSSDPGYGLAVRTNGVGLPGYKGGWFRLQNGQRALVFYTGSPKAVYLTTQREYSLLLSVERPDEFQIALRRAGG